jgi:ketosteroid isomerase-like protein
MNRSTRAVLAVLILFWTAASLAGQAADWKSLVETEKAFAQAALEKGLRTAFLEYLAGGALIFRPQPTPGRPFYEKLSPDLPTVLIWRPLFAEISGAADMGYTSGPYEVYKDRLTKEGSDYGHYVTIWKKQSGGEWQAILDIGVSHAEYRSMSDDVRAPAEPGPAAGGTISGLELGQAKLTLRTAEASFSKRSEAEGLAKAYKAYAADRIRFYRQGHFPALGIKAALKLQARLESPSSWTPAGIDVSTSADLGYTYGTGRLSHFAAGDSADKVERAFSYLHVWRKAGDGTWRIVLDLAVPYPSQ